MSTKINVVGSGPLWDENLRSWLEAFIARYPHQTTEVLSRSFNIGISRSSLDEYLEGTYFLPKEMGGKGHNPENSKIENAIRLFRLRVEGPYREGYSNTFLETRTWFQVQSACAMAIREKVIILLYGRPGTGKSRCLREFILRNLITAPLSILCSKNVVPSFFVKKIAGELNLPGQGSIPKIEDEIVERLNRNPRPLFVDQANYLDEKALGTICHIWESCLIPIVLAGTKDLYDLFITSNATEDVRAQLTSRVAYHYHLSGLLKEEAKGIIQRALGEDSTDETIDRIYKVTGGIHRHLNMIIPRILSLQTLHEEKLKSGKIRMEEIIHIAASRLMID